MSGMVFRNKILALLAILFVSTWPQPAWCDDTIIEKGAEESAGTAASQPLKKEPPPETMTGEWGGYRTKMRDRGVEFRGIVTLDDTWNLHGGKHRTRAIGEYEYLIDLSLRADSQPLLHYPGGTFFIEVESHHGKSPTEDDVGSFEDVDIIEASPFNALYSLWYKQAFSDNKFWVLAGKSDAWVDFEYVASTVLFFNAGYEAPPTILFFPTYPNPAMCVIGFATLPDDFVTVKLGVYDGSLADGAQTGKLGVTGHFFTI